jgi:phosphoribosylformylglycinamidine cyclo-ligase
MATHEEVNIQLGDDMSEALYEASKLTQQNRPDLLLDIGESFSGFRGIPLGQFPDVNNLIANLGFDGVGTKVEVAERTGDHSTVAHDLFAMVCDDAVVRGAETIAIGSILDVRKLSDDEPTRQAISQLAIGYVAAAELANVVVVNGEVAELNGRVAGYGDFNYNWGAAALWLAHRDRILTGNEIKAGDTVVGLAEHGFRSNGITDVRNAMREAYGDSWQDVILPQFGGQPLGEIVAKPSTIYSALVSELNGGYDITRQPRAKISGVAHITGGGQPSKIGRMLRQTDGLGIEITDPIDPPDIMKHVQQLRGFDDRTAYGKWHMGPGMIITTPEPDKVLEVAEERGIDAQPIGEVTDSGLIRIRSRGADTPDEVLEFTIEK